MFLKNVTIEKKLNHSKNLILLLNKYFMMMNWVFLEMGGLALIKMPTNSEVKDKLSIKYENLFYLLDQ